MAYVWRHPPRDAAQKHPDHEAVVTSELEFALRLKGVLESLDAGYSVTVRGTNYRPLFTGLPDVPPDTLDSVNGWLTSRGFRPLDLRRENK